MPYLKSLLAILLLFSVSESFSQIEPQILLGKKTTGRKLYQKTDSIPKVIHINSPKENANVAYFLDDVSIEAQVLKTIDTKSISAMSIEKDTKKLNDSSLDGAIYVTTKNEYQPSFISLNQLIEKYTELQDQPIIFLLNDDIIQEEPAGFLVNEKFIMKIEVTALNNFKALNHLKVVRLITRTEENLKKANTIRLR